MSHRREWAALAVLVLISTAFRAWAAVEVPVPWIAPDEMVYGMLGRNLWLHGSLTILGGPTPYYSLLTPVLVGFPLAAWGLHTGYDILQGLQAFVMSLAAVPVYLWARRLVSRRGALMAAALTLATPVLAYSGLLMTEVLFYPLLVTAAWAGAEAIARPTRRNQILLLVAFVAVCATRLQAIVLVPALATAAVLDAAIAHSWARVRRHLPVAAGFAVLVVGWAAWRLASGKAALGGYEVVASSSYSVGSAARFVLYHAASLLILCGLFPAVALALKLMEAVRRGEGDERVRAYLVVASSLAVWLVVEVGIYASRYSDRIVERNLIGLAPVLFIGLVLWLERGPDGGYVERGIVAALAVVVLVLLPVGTYVNVYGTHDAMTLIPLYRLSTETSVSTMKAVYPAVVPALALVFVLVPRRRLRWLPVALVLVLVGASVLVSRFVVDESHRQQVTFLGGDPSWSDDSGGRRVAYLYDGEPSWPGVWHTVFWNTGIDRVYDLGAQTVPGPMPQERVAVLPDGTIVVPPGKGKPRYVIASNWIELAGKPAGAVEQQGLTQRGLALWKRRGRLRMRSQTSGLELNGDISGQAVLVAYGCRSGTFRVTLLVKQSEKIDIRVDDKLVRHLEFPSPSEGQSWHGDFPVSQPNSGTCSLSVTSTGLTGTTQFAFDRG
ncbi:MAG: glycosyltransferase family 39 protein [Verrucomicrobiota bacterium]